jgi:UDP-GlcNAc:undecaprenyl-phosphate/decaprenyl-phosphate GlcNAc-1-phosphate transferase
MMRSLLIAVVPAASLLAALALTPWMRALAHRLGMVARPAADRWHRQPTALLGGCAIVLATLTGLLVGLGGLPGQGMVRIDSETAHPLVGVALSAAAMFVVGLVDDSRGLGPQLKFVLQTVAGVVVVSFGGLLSLTPSYAANVVLTLFWFVGVTNAFNLLDNMDGIAAGVACIASLFVGMTFASHGAWPGAVAAWSLTGATLGFLRYNFHPASIFMGDAGSLFLGSALAGLVVSAPGAGSGSLVSVIFVPLTIMAIPIVDTTLVTVTRTLSGRAISEGGRDHTTHRLVALGLGERYVAVLLYACAAVCGLVALWLTKVDRGLGVLLGTTFLVAMGLVATYLGRLQVADSGKVAQSTRVTVLVGTLLYKRRLAELLLDVVLVTLAYYGTYRLRFDGALPPLYDETFRSTVGLVIALKITMLGLAGVYRGAWQYVGMLDLYRILGGVAAGALGILVYGQWAAPALAASHSIVYIDALLTAALLLCSRLSFPSFELIRQRIQPRGKRALIYGADDGGELTLRQLRTRPDLGLEPVCFVDDDARRHGRDIHGVPIVAGFDGLAWVVEHYKIDRIVIGTRKLAPEGVAVIQALARGLGVGVAEVTFGLRWLPEVELPPNAQGAPGGTVAVGNGNGNGNGNGTGHEGGVSDVRAAG